MSNIDDIHSYGLDEKNREVYLHSFIDSPTDEDQREGGVDYRSAILLEKNLIKFDKHI